MTISTGDEGERRVSRGNDHLKRISVESIAGQIEESGLKTRPEALQAHGLQVERAVRLSGHRTELRDAGGVAGDGGQAVADQDQLADGGRQLLQVPIGEAR